MTRQQRCAAMGHPGTTYKEALLALIDTHRGPDWDDYRDALKERL